MKTSWNKSKSYSEDEQKRIKLFKNIRKSL